MIKFTNKITKKFTNAFLALFLVAWQIVFAVAPFTSQKAFAADTGYLTPTSAHAPNDWDVNAVANVQASDNQYVSENDGQEQGYSNFGIPAIAAGATIDGIEVKAEAKSTDNDCELRVRLSWNNGSNYTNSKDADLGSSDTYETLGDSNDTWGRTWAVGDFTNANFVVKIADEDPGSQCDGNAVVSVDHLKVKVYYSVPEPQKNQVDDWCGPYDGGVKFDHPTDGTINGIHADFSSDDKQVDISATAPKTAELVIVKAGSTGGNEGGGNQSYSTPPFNDLTAPSNKEISHVIVCYDEVKNGSIKVNKKVDVGNGYVDDNPSQYGFVWGVGNAVPSRTMGSTATDVVPGNYNITENSVNNYEFAGWYYNNQNKSCSDPNGTTLPAQIAVAEDQTTEITLCNRKQTGTVTLVKEVVNNNGGQLGANDFGLKIDGQAVNSGDAKTFPVGTQVAIDEAGAAGYAFVSITGTGCPAALGGTVTVLANQNVTCTIKNDDQPGTLILEKILPNNNGGNAVITDFEVFISGQLASWGSHTVDAGNYTVSENTIFGYLPSGWSIDCDANGNVTVGLGETKTCKITNDDVAPKLTLKKVVTNNNGGTGEPEDWTLTATPAAGPASVLSGNGKDGFDGKDAYAHTDYTLSESGPDGYQASDWDCYSTAGVFSHPNGNDTIKMSEGADVTCTITNDDKPPVVRVHKSAPQDTNQLFDFAIYHDNGTLHGNVSMSDGGTQTSGPGLKAGEVEVVETVPAGWYQSQAVCYSGRQQSLPTKFVAENGKEYDCYFENAKKASIKVIKDAQPNDAQDFHFTIEEVQIAIAALLPNTPVSDFDLDDDNDAALPNNQTTSVMPGYYKVTEDQVAGWDLIDMDCGAEVYYENSSAYVWVNSGDDVTCVFTNKKRTTPRVLGEVTPEAAVTELANTGQGYDVRGSLLAITLSGAAFATVTVRRKQAKK